VEIACNYAGIVMGIANTVGNLAGFVVTIVTGALIEGHVKDQII
jgi:nitrate/nitrite transporter NarK